MRHAQATFVCGGGPVILLAPDSFKGTFPAAAVADALAAGVSAEGGRPDRCPVADGGEGTIAVLLAATGGSVAVVRVHDPLGRPRDGRFALLRGLRAEIDATVMSGAAAVLDAVGFDARRRRAGAVVAGEGRIDDQSVRGKTVGEIAARRRA